MVVAALTFSISLCAAQAAPAAMETISLPEAVKRALASNPSAAIARDELYRAQTLVSQARSLYWPTVSLNAGYTRLDADRVLGDRVIAAANQFTGNVAVGVPLFAPKGWLAAAHAQDQVAVVQASTADVQRTLAVAVARTYLSVLTEHSLLGSSQRAVETAQAHYDYALERFKGGAGTQLDVFRAEQQLRAVEGLVQSHQTGLIRAQEALGVLAASDVPLDARAEELPLSPREELAKELDDAERRRQDLVAQQRRVEAATSVVNDHWADFAPLVSAAFQPFTQNPPTLTQPQFGWQAQLLLSWPIFDGGLRYAQQKERQVLLDEAKVGLDGTKRQLRSDIRAAFSAVEHADASLLSARHAAELAKKALELVNIAYRAGATTNIEVVDAQRSALDADTNATLAEETARQARVDLLSAIGSFP